MLGRTHFLTGAVAGYLTGGPVGILTGGMAALLPDVDTPDSTVGQFVKPVSWLIARTVGHRTIFHSLWPLLVMYYFIHSSEQMIPVMLGYASHLLLDMLTPEGICPLWPFPFRLSVPLARTGGLIDNLLSISMLGVGIYYLGHIHF